MHQREKRTRKHATNSFRATFSIFFCYGGRNGFLLSDNMIICSQSYLRRKSRRGGT